MSESERYALLAGGGEFPTLVLEEATRRGVDMIVIAIEEETWPEIEGFDAKVHWLSLGQLQKALDILRENDIAKVVMAGRVRHRQIFSDISADPVMQHLLNSLPEKNPDALLGGIAKALQSIGMEVVNSTLFLPSLLAPIGPITERLPTGEELDEIAFGRKIAREITRLDLGQTVVVSHRACIAVEAMEGTDATIARAAEMVNGRPLVVIKSAKPNQDMRFDVPVVGINTLETMKKANATVLALDAGATLMVGREEFVRRANEYEIAVAGFKPESDEFLTEI